MDATVLVALITAVIGPFVTLYTKDWIDSKKKKDVMETNVSHYVQIGDQLESLMRKMRADRVWMLQFHNGGNFYPTGKSIQKFSIFYEAVSNPSVPRVQHMYQNIPVSIFYKAFDEAQKTGEILIKDRLDNKIPTYGLKYALEQSNTRSSYLFKITTLGGKFTGAIAVSYTEATELSEQDLDDIRREVSAIGGMLSAYLKS
jgi:hypothetical protein